MELLKGMTLRQRIAGEAMRREDLLDLRLTLRSNCKKAAYADCHRFIAMELLKGMTLRQRIAGEAMRREDLLDFGIQIPNGLEAAHAEGIIHRRVARASVLNRKLT